jgi:hypothetical protein
MRSFAFLVASALAVASASCSSKESRKPTFPAVGKVTLPDGKPAEHASVVLHPAGDAGAGVPKPHGKVGPDGTYKLTTYDADDGAPAGEYKVTVELWLAGKNDEPPSNRLNPKYAKPETSGFTATVGTSPSEIKPLELKR